MTHVVQLLIGGRVEQRVLEAPFSSVPQGYTKKGSNFRHFLASVEVKGFEPPTLWSQTRCANRTALHLVLKCGANVLPFHVSANFFARFFSSLDDIFSSSLNISALF